MSHPGRPLTLGEVSLIREAFATAVGGFRSRPFLPGGEELVLAYDPTPAMDEAHQSLRRRIRKAARKQVMTPFKVWVNNVIRYKWFPGSSKKDLADMLDLDVAQGGRKEAAGMSLEDVAWLKFVQDRPNDRVPEPSFEFVLRHFHTAGIALAGDLFRQAGVRDPADQDLQPPPPWQVEIFLQPMHDEWASATTPAGRAAVAREAITSARTTLETECGLQGLRPDDDPGVKQLRLLGEDQDQAAAVYSNLHRTCWVPWLWSNDALECGD